MDKIIETYLMVTCLMLITTATSTVTVSQSQRINAQDLGLHLDTLMNETLGVKSMQERIDILDFKRERYNGFSLVKELSEKISNHISQHIEGLRKTTKILQDEIYSRKHKKSSQSIWTSCCQYPEEKTYFDKGFKNKVDFAEICELVSDTTPLEYYQVPKAVLSVMKQNHDDMPFVKWQYVGSNQGVFFSYPAQSRPDMCTKSHYDPRFRPWFVQTASPEEKHVVILLDSSNSMSRTHNSIRLLDIATEAIETLLDSFKPNDMVGIVAFNDTAFYPEACFSKQLAYLNTINKKKLKEEFLDRLQPGGQSQYTEAFRAAFQLLVGNRQHSHEDDSTEKTSSHSVILFISDGDASEIHHHKTNEIFRAIRDGNKNGHHVVEIISYGLGRDVSMSLLEKISEQDFDDILGKDDNTTASLNSTTQVFPKGIAYKIEEPSQLENQLTFFYASLEDFSIDSEEIKPSFSVPYFDTGSLGLIFTIGFPVNVKRQGRKFLAAVVAVAISIADLLGDVIKLKNDDRSYVFAIDGRGRVLIHPLLPVSDTTHDAPPPFIHIEVLERDPSLKSVINSMMQGYRGEKTVLSTRVAPAGDCNKVSVVNQTYHWHPVANTNFSVCFVEEGTDYMVHLAPADSIYGCVNESGSALVANQCPNVAVANFRYHRLDLRQSSDVCRHFYQISTLRSSVVKLAPQCFDDSAFYEQRSETPEQVIAYENMLNALLRATSQDEADAVLKDQNYKKLVYDVIRDDVISDIVWTAGADALWLKHPEPYVIRRYIGTRTGMVRFYPGTNISSSYDPVKRSWYELALAYPGMRVFSPPYKDAAGAGNVITISHTVHTPQLPYTNELKGATEEKVIGVMGIDLSLISFYAKMIELYPRCSAEWHCVIMDNWGYFILHKAYKEAEAPTRKHITGDDGPLSEILLERGLMYRTRCLGLETTKYKVSYVVVDDARVDELNNPDECKRYYMEPIPNSNVFFIGREVHEPCYYKTCVINNNLCHVHDTCVNHDDWSNATCECPCRADLTVNSCNRFVDVETDIVPCYPVRNSEPSTKNACLPKSLPPCYNTHCGNMTSYLTCSSVVGCTWCQKTTTGSILRDPYCTSTDVCYDGFEGHRLPGFELEIEICETASDEMDWKMFIIISVSGGFFIFVVILAAYFWYCKRNEKKLPVNDDPAEVTKSQSEINHEVATIAAAIGAKEKLPRRTGIYSQSNSSTGRRELRRSSASSVSSARQRYMSSPQVVLSIVDSEGEEIARSSPRPVQIVRGNQAGTSKDTATSSGAGARQIRANSMASIVIGSAGENSGFSSSGDTKSDTVIANLEASNRNSSEATFRKRRNLSAHAEEKQSSKTIRPDEKSTAADPVQHSTGSKADEKSQPKSSIAVVLRSVLRKKAPSKPSGEISRSGSELSLSVAQDLEPGMSYYNMFAEPTSNEGDIPIIQSDHSDSENRSNSDSSQYMAVCNGSDGLSSSSWAASERRDVEKWRDVHSAGELEDARRSKSEEVFFDDEMHEDVIDELSGQLSTNANARSMSSGSVEVYSPTEQTAEKLTSSEMSSDDISAKQLDTQRQKTLHNNKKPRRSKSTKSENFVVYV